MLYRDKWIPFLTFAYTKKFFYFEAVDMLRKLSSFNRVAVASGTASQSHVPLYASYLAPPHLDNVAYPLLNPLGRPHYETYRESLPASLHDGNRGPGRFCARSGRLARMESPAPRSSEVGREQGARCCSTTT